MVCCFRYFLFTTIIDVRVWVRVFLYIYIYIYIYIYEHVSLNQENLFCLYNFIEFRVEFEDEFIKALFEKFCEIHPPIPTGNQDTYQETLKDLNEIIQRKCAFII